MSIPSEGSTLVEINGVNKAVEQLQELGARMSSDDFGFGDEDIDNVDHVIDAIKDLESEMRKCHEKLETETIRSSVHRHTLQFLPAAIKKQLQDAVSSARRSNAEELQSLQDRLKKITDNITFLGDKYQKLEQDNAVLHPERDNVREEHEDIIAQLNQRMAEKASNQIYLNETRDRVRETNQKIVDLEEGIIQLKEDLIQERADARMEKKRLKKSVYDTTVKTREQKEMNIEKRREVDELHGRVLDLEGQLADLRKSIRGYETSRSKLEGQERAFTSQLQRQLKQNNDLRAKGLEITNEIVKQDAAFQEAKTELENQIRTLEEDLVYEAKREEANSIERLKLQAVVKDKMKIRQFDEKRVKEQNSVLQKSKGDLAVKAEDVARLRQENGDMESRIIELNETHEAIMATLHKQIEECRDTLAKERKERMSLQETRDTGQKNMDDMKVTITRNINDMNRRINEGKKQHDDLSKEGTTLQKAIREDDDVIKQLQEKLEKAKAYYKTEKERQESEVAQMKEGISNMAEEEVAKEDEIKNKEPTFLELEKSFADTEETYDVTKKEVIALKNKKTGLDDAVKRAKKDLEKMVNPRIQAKKELAKKRQESLELMKKHNEEVKEIESKIFHVGKKLRTALEENDRFVQSNNQLERNIVMTRADLLDNQTKTSKLEEQFQTIRGHLVEGWEGDRKLEKEFCARDEEVVQQLDQLLDKAAKRENVISDITFKLQDELSVLSDFLDNVAKRRPPGQSAVDGANKVPRPPSSARPDSQGSGRRSKTPRAALEKLETPRPKKSVTISPHPSKPNTPRKS